VKMALVIRA